MEPFWFFLLPFRRPYDSDYDSDFLFLPGHKRSYVSNSDSVCSKNQPFRQKSRMLANVDDIDNITVLLNSSAIPRNLGERG